MLDERSLSQLTAEIVSHGYDQQTAARFAVRIGDTPAFDDQRNVLVMDDAGAVMATLKPLQFFDRA